MPDPKIPLAPGNYYHIYNRGINGCPIFKEATNYEHFLRLYEKYISPVADTFAWVLMGNHFHLLVRTKDANNLQDLDLEGFKNLQGLNKGISRQFSNLFNAYSKAFNKRYNRTGSLFEHTFHRKLVTDQNYLKQIVLYIHNNPIHHGFCEHPIEYPWSSYLTCISVQPTRLKRHTVRGWFDSVGNFKVAHNNTEEMLDMDRWLGL